MSFSRKHVLIALIVLATLALAAGGTWLWFKYMEKRWVARPDFFSQTKNPMLAATLLLERHQYKVTTKSDFTETMSAPLPAGTLLLADSSGILSPDQTARILMWVRKGNTLITSPQWSKRERTAPCAAEQKIDPPEIGAQHPDGEDKVDPDPIGTFVGVELLGEKIEVKPGKADADSDDEDNQSDDDANKRDKNVPSCFVHVRFGENGYALQIPAEDVYLGSTGNARAPDIDDNAGVAVRVYREGKGHIVMTARNYFDNSALGHYDHAELLLSLGALNRDTRSFLIVQHLDFPTWQQALWMNFKYGLISAAVALLLLLWLAVRRFGPLLPEPEGKRRSLIEHVDASGRWLWRLPGGRERLLSAVRASTQLVLQRRAPELQRLQSQEQVRKLAESCKLSVDDVDSALYEPASKIASHFTRQIQTLQQLRRHHER